MYLKKEFWIRFFVSVASVVIVGSEATRVCAVDVALSLTDSWPGYRRGQPVAIATQGKHAFVAASFAGVQVVDISNPIQPRHVGEYVTDGYARGITVKGGSGFVTVAKTDFTSGSLDILDLSKPTAPLRIGRYATKGWADAIAVEGDFAYLADSSGFVVVSVANPRDPQKTGALPFSGPARSIVVAGSYVYAVDSSGVLQVIDRTDAQKPKAIRRYASMNSIEQVAVDSGHAFLAVGRGGVELLDLTNPADPQYLASKTLPGGAASSITLNGDVAIVSDKTPNGLGVVVLDISDPVHPAIKGTAAVGPVNAIAVDGTFGYAAAEELGVIDLKDSADPHVVYQEAESGAGQGVAVSAGRVLLADGDGGLRILEKANSVSHHEIGRVAASHDARNVVVRGSTAYLIDASSGLLLVDITSPATPTVVGTYSTSGVANSVVLDGTNALISVWSVGLEVIDVSSPSQPKKIGSFDSVGNIEGLALGSNHLLYLANTPQWNAQTASWQGGGLQIVDVSNPANPRRIAEANPTEYYYAVALSGSYLFVGAGGAGVIVFDVTDSTQPRQVASYSTGGFVEGLAVEGPLAFIANGVAGLQVLDVSNPSQPVRLVESTGFEANAVAIENNQIYVATGISGFVTLSYTPTVRLQALSMSESGNVEILVSGEAGQTFQLQRSNDLKNWDNLATASSAGTVQHIVDSDPASAKARFYRARLITTPTN